MSNEINAAGYAALPDVVKFVLQLFAIFGKTSNDYLIVWARLLGDAQWGKKLQRGANIGDVLQAHPHWFQFQYGELEPTQRNFALRDLVHFAGTARWVAMLLAQLPTQSYARENAEAIQRALHRLMVLGGNGPVEIERQLGAVRCYYLINSSDSWKIAQALPILIAPDLFEGMDIQFQVACLARRLYFNLRLPCESVLPWANYADKIYQLGSATDVPYLDKLLVAHTQAAMLLGIDAPKGIDDLAWLAQYWAGYQLLNAGAVSEAANAFEAALKGFRADVGGRGLIGGLFTILHFIALYAKNDAAAWKQLNAMLKSKQAPDDLLAISFLQQYGRHLLDPTMAFEPVLENEHAAILDFMVVGLLMRWTDVPFLQGKFTIKMTALAERAEAAGLAWLARQLHAVLAPPAATGALVMLKGQTEPWQELIQALEDSGKKIAPVRAEQASRLQICIAQPRHEPWFSVELAEQRVAKDGKATEPKPIKTRANLKAVIARLSDEQDLRIANICFRDADFLTKHFTRSPAEKRAFWLDLISHPAVYFWPPAAFRKGNAALEKRAAAEFKVDVLPGQLALKVHAGAGAHARIELKPKVELLSDTFGLSFSAASPTKADAGRAQISLIDISPAQRRVMAMVAKGIAIPNTALPQMAELAARPGSPVKLSMDAAAGAQVQPANCTPHVLIEPNAGGLHVTLQVRPFGVDVGPYFAPAEGDRRVLGVINGSINNADRDFAAEAAALSALLRNAPILAQALDAGGSVTDPEVALDLLSELQSAQPAPVLAWPKGKARRVLSAGKFSLKSKANRDWLGIEGELEHSEGTIKLSELIGLLESSRGRYLTLDGERFIELSDSLRKHVQSLANFSDARGKVEVPLLAGAVLLQQLGLEQVEGLKLANVKMAEAFTLAAEVPTTLQAELRDYQIAGYRWLMQMAHWGAGACLADDMGLGKTIQTLALLLARAPAGPAIVLAPTSVIGNWQRESARFAPTLKVLRFDELDRTAKLPHLAAFDVLLVSYGLLSTHSETLTKQHFHSIVLDEAQAIKNAATQRAQAACALQGDFRVATSGTPLENHLGELWSLMRFLNPGLLSSQEKFQRRFSGPIERDPSSPAKAVLRQLIAPFLLRRTKAQVLSELPPKTEITLTIAPSAEEAQLVAGLRAAALNKLNSMDNVSAEKRFHILAEITRLRRAACHPDLVAPELKISSAKLTQLLELVAELKENRHRALIFSQFVDYLSIVRKAFDAAGFSYQYLDGSTATKAREAAVSAFQAGVGDVFLLSLKAGGVGLNLTAADYVIHLDPWWNPAVEQQASDRAHRIGQTRPVTIYRLVLQGSIEEQILSLHGQKRELIDSMLSDRETAKPVSADELLALISGK